MGVVAKCCFPGCKVVGEVPVAGRPYACDLHTAWIVAGYSGIKNVAVEFVKRNIEKKLPWWARTFVEGAKSER